MAEAAHSTFSASGADRWMQCPGSIVLAAGAPRTTSQYAAEGTFAHMLLTRCLLSHKPALDYIGMEGSADGFNFTVDEDMARHVQVCIDYVHDLMGEDGILLVDQRVNYAKYLGVPEDQAWGTADVIVVRGDEVIVVDFKYGQGVEVSAGYDAPSSPADEPQRHPNRQMALYALGVVDLVESTLGDKPARVRLAISQPRISVKPSEYDLLVEELEAWGYGEARSAACSVVNADKASRSGPGLEGIWPTTFLRPGEKQCRFCPAKATCPALRNAVSESVLGFTPASPDEFSAAEVAADPKSTDSSWLSASLGLVDLIEDWCKAVRAEVERRLLAGEPVPGFKLVQGKRGARQWNDPDAAEKLLRETFRLPIEKAYDMNLISPTSAEKLAKAGDIGPRQWPKAQSLIVQPEGKTHVAPVTDPRPAIDVKPVADEFQPVAEDLA